MRQQKFGAQIDIPVMPELQSALDMTPTTGQLTFITNGTGQPYTPGGFGDWFADCCNKAELPKNCRAHGLREGGGDATGRQGSHRPPVDGVVRLVIDP